MRCAQEDVSQILEARPKAVISRILRGCEAVTYTNRTRNFDWTAEKNQVRVHRSQQKRTETMIVGH